MPIKQTRKHRGGHMHVYNPYDTLMPILRDAEDILNAFGEAPTINTMEHVIEIINIFIEAAQPLGSTNETRDYRDILLHMIYDTMEEANNAGMDDETADSLPQLGAKIQELQQLYNNNMNINMNGGVLFSKKHFAVLFRKKHPKRARNNTRKFTRKH